MTKNIIIKKDTYSFYVSDNGTYSSSVDDTFTSYPKNSVYYVKDADSDLVTFKSTANGQTLFTIYLEYTYFDSTLATADNLNSLFASYCTSAMGGGGSGTLPDFRTINGSGLTGDTQDLKITGATVVRLTKAQYDALSDSEKLDIQKIYIITDAISDYYTKEEVDALIDSVTSGATPVMLQTEYDALTDKTKATYLISEED